MRIDHEAVEDVLFKSAVCYRPHCALCTSSVWALFYILGKIPEHLKITTMSDEAELWDRLYIKWCTKQRNSITVCTTGLIFGQCSNVEALMRAGSGCRTVTALHNTVWTTSELKGETMRGCHFNCGHGGHVLGIISGYFGCLWGCLVFWLWYEFFILLEYISGSEKNILNTHNS